MASLLRAGTPERSWGMTGMDRYTIIFFGTGIAASGFCLFFFGLHLIMTNWR